jgi:hypothetical protein
VRHWPDWVTHQSYDEYRRAVSMEDASEKVKVPAHILGGWFDLLLNGTLNGYVGTHNRAGTEAARRGPRMIVGPWGHGASQKYGDVDFGPDAMRNAFDRECIESVQPQPRHSCLRIERRSPLNFVSHSRGSLHLFRLDWWWCRGGGGSVAGTGSRSGSGGGSKSGAFGSSMGSGGGVMMGVWCGGTGLGERGGRTGI